MLERLGDEKVIPTKSQLYGESNKENEL